jgi:RNA polymerase sigma-70 factor (ECF subfamily)
MADPGVDLIRRIQHGDEAALEALMSRHSGLLRVHLTRYVGAVDAEDLLQELWLRVWDRAGQWDGRGRPLGWLLAIATNIALNHLRGRRPAVRLGDLREEDELGETPAEALEIAVPGPEEQALWRGELARLRSAIAELPLDKQAALRLVRVEGYSVREAAEVLGVPAGTLKSRLHHAGRLLMERLEEAQ